MFQGRFRLPILVLSLVALAAACSHDGALEIELDVETEETALNPLRNPALSSFTLTLTSTSFARRQNTQSYLSGLHRLGFGDIPTGVYQNAAVSAISFSGALIAHGEHRGSFRVEASEPTRIQIPLRFPFVYASGGTELPAIHPELDSGSASFSNLMVGVPADITSASAVSPDGKRLVVFTVNPSGAVRLWMYLTGNHQRIVEFQMPRPDRVSTAAFSPDGQVLMLASLDGEWAAFLDVPGFLEGANRAGSFIYQEVPRPVAGGFLSGDSAVVLSSSPYRHTTCDQPPSSQLTWYMLTRFRTHGIVEEVATTAVGSYTAGLAVDAAGDRVFLAHPCSSEISSMRPGQAAPAVVLGLLNLSPCLRPVKLLADESALTVACVTAADTVSPQWSAAKLLIQRFGLYPQLSPSARTMVMDYPSEPIDYSKVVASTIPPGTGVLLLQAPERVLPTGLGLSAQGNRLVVVVEAYYKTPEIVIGGARLLETRSKSHSLVFVDTRLSRLDRRVRTACFPVDDHLDDTPPEGGISASYCTDNMGAIETTSFAFIPSQLSIVYGSP